MRELATELRALPMAHRFAVASTEYELRDFSLVDVNDAGCSKGSTLAQWAGTGGVAREEVMAVGDNLNDLEMLEFAGTAVVMGNASAAMRPGAFIAPRATTKTGSRTRPTVYSRSVGGGLEGGGQEGGIGWKAGGPEGRGVRWAGKAGE